MIVVSSFFLLSKSDTIDNDEWAQGSSSLIISITMPIDAFLFGEW